MIAGLAHPRNPEMGLFQKSNISNERTVGASVELNAAGDGAIMNMSQFILSFL